MGRGKKGASSSKQPSKQPTDQPIVFRRLGSRPHRGVLKEQQLPSLSQPPSQQQMPNLSQPPSQQQIPNLSKPPSGQQLQQQPPPMTQQAKEQQQQLPTLSNPPPHVPLQQPPRAHHDLGEEAAMEEEDGQDVEEQVLEQNLEAELAAEFSQLDPALDASLEEEISHAVQKTGRGMDKGDEAPTDPTQRKRLTINHRGEFSHERFGRTATVIWKYLYDEAVLFWSNWPEDKKRLAWEMFQKVYCWEEDNARVYRIWRKHCRNRFRDELHQVRKRWDTKKQLPEFMHKETFKVLLAKWKSPKYAVLQERGKMNRAKGPRVTHTTGCISIGIHEDRMATKRGGVRPGQLESYMLTHTTRRANAQADEAPVWACPEAEETYNIAQQKYLEKHGPNREVWPDWDPELWKEVVGPPKKGQMRGMSTLQDPAEHGVPWRRYETGESASSTTRMLTAQVQQLQNELATVRQEMAERVQAEVAARIQTEVSQRVSEMEAAFERRFQAHIAQLSQQYSSVGFPPPQMGGPPSTASGSDQLPAISVGPNQTPPPPQHTSGGLS